MKQRTICKTLAVSVIILFLGLAIQPSVAVKPDDVNVDYYDVTTEFIGLGKEHTIQLTQEEIEELELLFDNLRDRLDNVKTEYETIQIFNEGIRELGRYGLLGDMSVKQVQRLIIGSYHKSKVNPLPLDDNENRGCLIIGSTELTWIDGPFYRLLSSFMTIEGPDNLIGYILELLKVMLLIRLHNIQLLNYFRPIYLDGYIGFQNTGSDGWVWTIGLNGIKSWNGTLLGRITKPLLFLDYASVGFIGIKIVINRVLYIGFTRQVKIEYKDKNIIRGV